MPHQRRPAAPRPGAPTLASPPAQPRPGPTPRAVPVPAPQDRATSALARRRRTGHGSGPAAGTGSHRPSTRPTTPTMPGPPDRTHHEHHAVGHGHLPPGRWRAPRRRRAAAPGRECPAAEQRNWAPTGHENGRASRCGPLPHLPGTGPRRRRRRRSASSPAANRVRRLLPLAHPLHAERPHHVGRAPAPAGRGARCTPTSSCRRPAPLQASPANSSTGREGRPPRTRHDRSGALRSLDEQTRSAPSSADTSARGRSRGRWACGRVVRPSSFGDRPLVRQGLPYGRGAG
jgi:hypothetical protein